MHKPVDLQYDTQETDRIKAIPLSRAVCGRRSARWASFWAWNVLSAIKRYSKGVWGMPWRTQAMKDVARCDKLR